MLIAVTVTITGNYGFHGHVSGGSIHGGPGAGKAD